MHEWITLNDTHIRASLIDEILAYTNSDGNIRVHYILRGVGYTMGIESWDEYNKALERLCIHEGEL